MPDENLLALKAMPDVLASRIRLAAAIMLYVMGQLLSGCADQRAGVGIHIASTTWQNVAWRRSTSVKRG
jgi:hypothetical protein